MNKKILYQLLAGILLLGCVVLYYAVNPGMDKIDSDRQERKSRQEAYTCPMHPSVVSDKPGACPVCGMALVKKSLQSESSEEEIAALGNVTLSSTQRVMANIAVASAERRLIGKEISAVGVVDIAEPMQAKVTARMRGRIEKLYVNFTGEVIQQGAPLLELYSPELYSAQQEFLLALTSQSEIADALYSTETQQQLVAASREKLRLTFGMTEAQIVDIETTRKLSSSVTYYSPISGTVLAKNVQTGEYVNEGTVLYRLANLSKVWVTLDVYEKDVRHLSLHQKVQITTESYPGEMFIGNITFIDPVLNPETRTVRIRTEFTNTQNKLKPQMWVQASVVLPEKEAVTVATSSILVTGKRTILWIETEENVFEPREIRTGIQSGGYTEILSPELEGERIVITGGYLLESESTLQKPADSNTEHKDARSSSEIGEIHTKNEIHVLVKGNFTPDVLHVKKGKKVRLDFYRDEDSRCSEEVVFPRLNIRKKLTAFDHTIIEFMPEDQGEIQFTCGMDMLHGKIIVHE